MRLCDYAASGNCFKVRLLLVCLGAPTRAARSSIRRMSPDGSTGSAPAALHGRLGRLPGRRAARSFALDLRLEELMVEPGPPVIAEQEHLRAAGGDGAPG